MSELDLVLRNLRRGFGGGDDGDGFEIEPGDALAPPRP